MKNYLQFNKKKNKVFVVTQADETDSKQMEVTNKVFNNKERAVEYYETLMYHLIEVANRLCMDYEEVEHHKIFIIYCPDNPTLRNSMLQLTEIDIEG